MSVTVNQADLEFILAQIKISEAHAAGQPLFGPGGLVPAYNVSLGLRTVDGTYNNLLHETWGAADQQFPSLMDPVYRPADGTPVRSGRARPGARHADAANYNPSNNPNSLVFDSSLRTISNLLVDQTLGNPAAILTALDRAGSANPMADLAGRHRHLPDLQARFRCRVPGPRRGAERPRRRGGTRRWRSRHAADRRKNRRPSMRPTQRTPPMR